MTLFLLDDDRRRLDGEGPQVVDDLVPLRAVGHRGQRHVRLAALEHPHHPVPLSVDPRAEQLVAAATEKRSLILPEQGI